jgi:hypothetical protein
VGERLSAMRAIAEITGIRRFSVGMALTSKADRALLEACLHERTGVVRESRFGVYLAEPNVRFLKSFLASKAGAEDRIDWTFFVGASRQLVRGCDAEWASRKNPAVHPGLPWASLRTAIHSRMREAVEEATSVIGAPPALGLMDAFRAEAEDVESLLEVACRLAPSGLRLHDTSGSATPHGVVNRLRQIRTRLPGVPVHVHFHDDFGLAAGNTIAAIVEGVDGFDASVAGLGARAGNASTQEILAALDHFFGSQLPGAQLHRLTELSRSVEKIFGSWSDPFQPITGPFTHHEEWGYRSETGTRPDELTFRAFPPGRYGGRVGHFRSLYSRDDDDQALEGAGGIAIAGRGTGGGGLGPSPFASARGSLNEQVQGVLKSFETWLAPECEAPRSGRG